MTKYWKLRPEGQRHGSLADDIEPALDIDELLKWMFDIIGVTDITTLAKLKEQGYRPMGCGCCARFPVGRESWMNDDDAETYGVKQGWFINDEYNLTWKDT